MSWIQALCETYDNYFGGEPLSDTHPLVPVGFLERQMDICIKILPDGKFSSASVLEDRSKYPVPSSPAAEGRTGSSAIPYPLCEELRYVAGDLTQYSQTDQLTYFTAYYEQFCTWCEVPDAPPELLTLKAYLERKTVVSDLVKCKLLYLDDNKKIRKKWDDRRTKPVFFTLKKPAEKCIVDFAILCGNVFVPLREIESVKKSWQKFLFTTLPGKQLCYSSGQQEPAIYNHAKIEGNAKLISAKDDKRDFQFKGRFTSSEQAYSVSYQASSKAHNTLRWLRDSQGFRKYGSTFIAWSTTARQIIAPQDEVDDGWGAEDKDDEKRYPKTEQAYGRKIASAMAGFKAAPEYQKGSKIIMLGMEAATPGRMSISFYQEIDGSEYLERLNLWYTRCLWRLPRWGRPDNKLSEYITTPNLEELGEAVFGVSAIRTANSDMRTEKSVTKQVRAFNIEMLSCIVNGRPVADVFSRSAFRRSCRPESFTNKSGKWQRADWLKCLAVTCAMERSTNEKEEYEVSLNSNESDKSYLFGRLMAVADCVEIKAMDKSDSQHRQTNAIRYFSAVQQRPAVTWAVVEARLQPYLTKLRSTNYEKEFRALLDEIIGKFKPGDMMNPDALTPRFLEGYHCQRYEVLNPKK